MLILFRYILFFLIHVSQIKGVFCIPLDVDRISMGIAMYSSRVCYCANIKGSSNENVDNPETEKKNSGIGVASPPTPGEINTFENCLFTLFKVLECLTGIFLNNGSLIAEQLEFERRNQLKLGGNETSRQNKNAAKMVPADGMVYHFFNYVFPYALNVFFTRSILKQSENTEEDNREIIKSILDISNKKKDDKDLPKSARDFCVFICDLFEDGKCKDDSKSRFFDFIIDYVLKAFGVVPETNFEKKLKEDEQNKQEEENAQTAEETDKNVNLEETQETGNVDVKEQSDEERIKLLILEVLKKNFQGVLVDIYEESGVYIDDQALFEKILKGDEIVIPKQMTLDSKFLEKFTDSNLIYTKKEYNNILDFVNRLKIKDKSQTNLSKLYENNLHPLFTVPSVFRTNAIVNLVLFSCHVIFEFIQDYKRFPVTDSNLSEEETRYISMCKEVVDEVKMFFMSLLKEANDKMNSATT